MTDESNFINAPIFHSMICRDCEKNMQGGFQQPDNSFLCALCLIKSVEKDSIIFCINHALEFIEKELIVGKRPKKLNLKTARSWLLAARNKK